MRATNVTELIRDAALDQLLYLCGNRLDERISDYEYFCTLCKSLHLLKGHPLADRFIKYVTEILNERRAIEPQNAAVIWHAVADYMQEHAFQVGDFTAFCKDIPTKSVLYELHPHKSELVWHIDQAPVCATSWGGWERDLSADYTNAINSGCTMTQITITEQLPWRMPSVYHVEQALQNAHGAGGILSFQRLRYVAIALQKSNTPLLIETPKEGIADLIGALEQLDRTVGLPPVILSLSDINHLPLLVDFAQQKRASSVRLGLRITSDTGSGEQEMLQTIARVYPIGRLFLYRSVENTLERFLLHAI